MNTDEKISYGKLARRVGDMVLCNNINIGNDYWFDEIENGNNEPEDWNEEENGEWEIPEIYQSYIINDSGADYLKRNTNEIIQYHEKLDVYVWHITHFGTAWDYVFTSIKSK